MKRKALTDLARWYSEQDSKPLIIRGARQVGKSTLVKLFCEEKKLQLIEVNLETTGLKSINSDSFIIQDLLDEIQFKTKKIIDSNTVIFLDEIQESPRMLKFLRYFYEQAPSIKVIAAGPLLEMALKTENFSFPVGRVQFYHLGPMSFQEFLWATNNHFLDQKLGKFEFSEALHETAIKALQTYFYTGGMPEVVQSYATSKSLIKTRELQSQILQSYLADFPKYNYRINAHRISRVFSGLALNVGEKVIYKKLDTESKSREVKRILKLLIDSKVIIQCLHSSANYPPLLGESDLSTFKTYFLDIGLLGSLLNLAPNAIDYELQSNFNIQGKFAEQYVAQHLYFFNGPKSPPLLHYHLKDKGSQKAEIDFLIEKSSSIYPIEVKSSATGHLKSLLYFCKKNKSQFTYKFSLAQYSEVSHFAESTTLINLPLYAVEYLKGNLGNNKQG